MTEGPTFSAGVAALEAGRYVDALALFMPLAQRSPPSETVLLALASAQLGVGDAAAALRSAQAARAITQDKTSALYVLAPAAALAGNEALFRSCLDRLGELAASEIAALGAFWTTRLTEHGQLGAAADVQRRLVALLPQDYAVRIAYADTLLRIGESAAAGAALAAALQLDRSRSEAHALLAQQRLQSGDLDGAKKSALTAIAGDPHAVPAYAALAEIDPAAIDETMAERLSEVVRETRTSPENRAAAGMALAAALDASARYEDAFAAIVQARRELAHADAQRGRRYQRDLTTQKADAEMRLFSTAALAKPASDPARGGGLVFIVGMPRSGSTLVDQALASHSRVISRGESNALPSVRAEFDAELARRPDPDAATARHGERWDLLYRAGARAPLLVDKNLFNFWNVGLIARLFPAARVILVRRDPVDVCFSIFRRAFLGEHPFANDLEDLAHYHRCFDRLADHWLGAAPESVLEVSYEALVQDFETGVRVILAHCGLTFEAACLRFHENTRPVATSSAAQVRRPLFTAGVGRWRPYARQLQPLIAALEKYKRI